MFDQCNPIGLLVYHQLKLGQLGFFVRLEQVVLCTCDLISDHVGNVGRCHENRQQVNVHRGVNTEFFSVKLCIRKQSPPSYGELCDQENRSVPQDELLKIEGPYERRKDEGVNIDRVLLHACYQTVLVVISERIDQS